MTLDHSILTATKSHFCSLLKSNIFVSSLSLSTLCFSVIHQKHTTSISLWRIPIVFLYHSLQKAIISTFNKAPLFRIDVFSPCKHGKINNHQHLKIYIKAYTNSLLLRHTFNSFYCVFLALCQVSYSILDLVFNFSSVRTFLSVKVESLLFHRPVPSFLALL